MTWQRVARMVIAAAGIGFAAVLYVRTDRHRVARPVLPTPTRDDKASVEVTSGTQLRFSNGKQTGTLAFVHSSTYPDGRTHFEGITLHSIRGTREFVVRAEVADELTPPGHTGTAPQEIALHGNVRVEANDGFQLKSDEGTYTDATQTVRMPGPMTFSRGRLTGSSVGATYDDTNEVLVLLSQADVTAAADPKGNDAMHAHAVQITLDRRQKILHLDQQAVLEHDRSTLAADTIVAHLTDDEQGIKGMELRGHSSVLQTGGGPAGPPAMRADDINLTIHPESRLLQHATLIQHASLVEQDANGSRTVRAPFVDMDIASDGNRLTRLEAHDGVEVITPATKDTAARDVKAATLLAQGNDHDGLKTASFDGKVNFDEHIAATKTDPTSERTATSQSLLLNLDGDLGSVSSADFRGDWKFTDGDTHADAPFAHDDMKTDALHLQTAAGSRRRPHVQDADGVNVEGDTIDFEMTSHNLTAVGGVTGQFTQSAAKGNTPATKTPAVFDADKPVIGTGDKLTYDSGKHLATFVGKGTVWQDGGNRVTGETVALDDQAGDLTASGHVESSFVLQPANAKPAAASPDDAPKAPSRAHAEKMVYRDAEHKVTYTKGDGPKDPRADVTGPDGTLLADRIEMFVKTDDHTLERLEAYGSVHTALSTDRVVDADRLTYTAIDDTYVITGTPVVMVRRAADNKGPTCDRSEGTRLNYVRSTGASDFRSDRGGPANTVSCKPGGGR